MELVTLPLAGWPSVSYYAFGGCWRQLVLVAFGGLAVVSLIAAFGRRST